MMVEDFGRSGRRQSTPVLVVLLELILERFALTIELLLLRNQLGLQCASLIHYCARC